MDSQYDMPDLLIALLVKFLENGNGQLSKRARTNEFKEFKELTADEVESIEQQFHAIFLEN